MTAVELVLEQIRHNVFIDATEEVKVKVQEVIHNYPILKLFFKEHMFSSGVNSKEYTNIAYINLNIVKIDMTDIE